jgi:hypothetical protein
MSEHPKPIVLEQLSVGELAGGQRESIARHVEECSACRAFLDELEAAQEAQLAALPPQRFVALVAERRDRARRRLRRGLAAGVMALAAAALLLLIPRSGPRLQLKGAGLTVHRLRTGNVRVLATEDTIRSGDALRVVVTLSRPGTAAAWFVDARGRVDRLLPDGLVSLAAGEQPLPGSAVVEAPCYDLLLVVGIDTTQASEEQLRRAVASGVPAGADWLPQGTMARRLRCE